jgi:Asp-tRNA(Asn)/Glu-tRNA(Gln) amidotransferase A subunit family amidase
MAVFPPTNLQTLVPALKSGELSLSQYLHQLEPYFEAENARVHAFLPEADRFARLRAAAKDLEARYPTPAERPPLYGVLFGVKDIFHVEGFPTRAGSTLPPEELTGPQAEVVSQLKAAGAVVLGKTVTTEFAYYGPGPTVNPHNPAHTPGGSSSGSAAAVAAQLCGLTLGSQTIGSTVRPAAFCGVVGFKPTYGRASLAGVIPVSVTLDHVGFFTRTVASVALVAEVVLADWQGLPSLAAADLPRLGVPTGPYLAHLSLEGASHFQATQEKLKQAGFTIEAVEVLPNFETLAEGHRRLMAYEAAQTHETWFAEYGDRYHAKTKALIEMGHSVSADEAAEYRAGQETARRHLRQAMTAHGVSLWLAPPAIGPAPKGLDSTGDPIMNLPWTYTGWPALNLPSGLSDNGLPLGLQVTAEGGQDEFLLAWAGRLASVL